MSKALFKCKMANTDPVGPHVLKMIGYIENLERLGFPLSQELATDFILQSLPDKYSQFVMNYNMNDFNKPLPELLSMLRTTKAQMIKDKPNSVLIVSKEKGKSKGKAKAKMGSKPKPKANSSALKAKGGVDKGECHHCHKNGH